VLVPFALALIPVSADIRFQPSDHPANVYVVGDFDDWKAPGEKLVLGSDGQTWQTTLKLDPGVYRYVYLENDQKLPDPDALKDSEHFLTITPPEYKKSPGDLDDGQITASAIRHRPLLDVTRVNERTFQVAIRVRKDDVRSVTVTVSQPDHDQKNYSMVKSASNPLFDEFSQKIVVVPSLDFDYRFLLNDGAGPRAFDTRGLSGGVIGGGDAFHLTPATIKEAGKNDDPIAGKY